jgi:hypothetical protein
MNRLEKSVLWTLAAFVFCFLAIHVLIVKAPAGAAQTEHPATDPSDPTEDPPVPEDADIGFGRGGGRTAPGPDRVFLAVCVGDKGEPLDDVIVEIFRETPTESLFDPRVESFGQSKTQDGGQFAVTLPLIQRPTGKGDESTAKYILYFTAPGRPIKSMTVDNGATPPKQIVIPKESAEHVYTPTHHLVIAKPTGITISPILSAIRGFGKDGLPIRVEKFIDERNDAGAMAYPRPAGEPNRKVAVFAPRNARPADIAKNIQSLFADRARVVVDDRSSTILVQADNETHAEIHDLIKFLDKAAESRPAPDSAGMSAPQVQSDSLAKQLQQEQLAFRERIRALRQKLSEASSQEDKKAAREQLRKRLAEVFDQDMQMRKKAAAEIEARLAKLRQEYEARQTARNEIIDLQLKVIEQDDAGLEFPGAFPGGGPPKAATPSDPAADRGMAGGSAGYSSSDGEALPKRRRELPAGSTRVDQFDPIPKERTLDEVRNKVDLEVLSRMTERGHFVLSLDLKYYAYANVQQPSGPSVVRAVDSSKLPNTL